MEESKVENVPPPLSAGAHGDDDGDDWSERADAPDSTPSRQQDGNGKLEASVQSLKLEERVKEKENKPHEEAEGPDEEEEKKKRHVNLVFIGHVGEAFEDQFSTYYGAQEDLTSELDPALPEDPEALAAEI